ncbi:glycogen/starch/alpha-glucan phosphorylase [Desulfobulbus oligotrophicus]|jgi:starch phosphorylase|uniref:Alpha-1,4 glucan phosphorylase n=1 Tax=Desulfobulbus oligotrophicus TaxID=1909699 RepID=A0A7T5VD77_9BACT|nr:glycogen/starch/alpha-glucan phosphorylase [Desulfobulbus oligotrophicus]MDY0391358.1 glycogen/starch/alpha-glucan phosphorylase [Desulfobulbus oligotrophicus]QQG65604.1 glycogen/starch/alpha-glucan phosphorylase [Desulfobulbus oligotrophicus]
MDKHIVDPADNHAYASVFQGTGIEDFKICIRHHLMSFQGRDPDRAGDQDVYRALSYALRDVLMEKWIKTQKTFYAGKMKRVYYLSLEFLVGRSLGTAILNMGLMDEVTQAIEQLGYDLEELRDCEEDAALGNGGLGRLASCFMDSIATMKIPAYGYGIRYDFGLFNQRIVDGYQVETPDSWLRLGSPWMYERTSFMYPVQFYGHVTATTDKLGNYRARWVDTEIVMAMACDMLVPGFNNDHVINMRLWRAKASRELDLRYFNVGDYISAVESKVLSETISKVLYPSDDISEGQELRLKQQYFFVAATFQDILRRYRKDNDTFDDFPNQVAVQLNDTHPAIAIPELMRLLLDIEGLGWEQAWNICVNTFAYTNHTLMPEALETWPVDMLGRVLPRHLEIIYEINRRFLEEVANLYPGNTRKIQEMSLIEEGSVRRVRMANLAIVGSHSVNGVAALHSELLKTNLFRHFHEMWPDKINSKTNGITPRRWLLKCNQGLAGLIGDKIGFDWVVDLDKLRGLESYCDDPVFHQQWQTVKLENKKRLARIITATCAVDVDPGSLFDIQVKRIHEYKRQLLNVLHAIDFYHRIITHRDEPVTPRTIIFAGKAAPSYWKAKLIIKLINSVGDVVNNDPRVGDRLKVVFIPNYSVSLAERIIPAADLSEQISTAGTEASGTGNMKFALNGALTIGTLDGANIEIREEVGAENIFIFGMTAEEAEYEKKCKSRKPWQIYEANPAVRQIIDAIGGGAFSNGDTELFRPLVNDLLSENDPYLLLLDLESYLDCQRLVGQTYVDKAIWTRRSILNVARMGKFSSDRTIKEYAEQIWGLKLER